MAVVNVTAHLLQGSLQLWQVNELVQLALIQHTATFRRRAADWVLVLPQLALHIYSQALQAKAVVAAVDCAAIAAICRTVQADGAD